MNIAFAGAHGTGKTTSLLRLEKSLTKKTNIIHDQYRHIARELNYTNPREIILESGLSQRVNNMSAFIGSALGSLSQLDLTDGSYVLTDLDPLTYYAYYQYWVTRDSRERDIVGIALPFIQKLTKYYTSKYHIHFYFPINVIPLLSDDMRSNDFLFQEAIDKHLREVIDEFNVDKVKFIQSDSVEGRLDEMLYWINKYDS